MNREQITAMLAGLDGVTPGPWQRSGVRQNITENCIMVGPDGFSIAALPWGRHEKDHSGAFRDAAHIARCDPSTIRALCELALRGLELDKLMATRTPVAAAIKMLTDSDALRAENERLRSAGSALIADVKRRHPGEDLRCQFMRGLDAALERKPE